MDPRPGGQAAADRLARERLARGGVAAAPRHAELAAPQLLAQHVPEGELRRGGLRHELLPAGVARDGGGGVAGIVAGDGEDEGEAAAELTRAGVSGVAAPHCPPCRPLSMPACAGFCLLLLGRSARRARRDHRLYSWTCVLLLESVRIPMTRRFGSVEVDSTRTQMNRPGLLDAATS
jgi:hypothetical protein